jgi:pimeloyl-ACP methyl ester carboxylesterase
MGGFDFDAAVDDAIRAYAVPRRLREPRLADRLQTVDPVRVSTRWGDLSAWRVGRGPAVLLVHGWEDDNSLWSPLIDELDRRGRSLVAFDLPGHGASQGERAIFEGTDGIIEVGATLGPIDAVVAHSAGSGMTVAAFGEGWRVQRAVLIAPPLDKGDRWVRLGQRLGASDAVIAAAKKRYYEPHGSAREAWEPRTAYLEIDCETLVVYSRDDELHSFKDAEEIVRRVPSAQFVLVDGLTHRRTARDPDVIRLAADFVGSR